MVAAGGHMPSASTGSTRAATCTAMQHPAMRLQAASLMPQQRRQASSVLRRAGKHLQAAAAGWLPPPAVLQVERRSALCTCSSSECSGTAPRLSSCLFGAVCCTAYTRGLGCPTVLLARAHTLPRSAYQGNLSDPIIYIMPALSVCRVGLALSSQDRAAAPGQTGAAHSCVGLPGNRIS